MSKDLEKFYQSFGLIHVRILYGKLLYKCKDVDRAMSMARKHVEANKLELKVYTEGFQAQYREFTVAPIN